jgi:S-layer homology domain
MPAVTITIRLRRPARGSVALVLGALLLLTPAVVLANHQFSDVPPGGFHDQISAIAKAGITGGFNDGTYRPSEPVTRQAMAAFMHRGFGRVAIAAGTPVTWPAIFPYDGELSGDSSVVRDLTIEVPGANSTFGPEQLVHVQGRVTFLTNMTTAQGCPCEFKARIVDPSALSTSPTQTQTFYSPVTGEFGYSFDVEWVFVAPPGARTYELQVQLSNRASLTGFSPLFWLDPASSLSAMTFPFGPTGGNTP